MLLKTVPFLSAPSFSLIWVEIHGGGYGQCSPAVRAGAGMMLQQPKLLAGHHQKAVINESFTTGEG